MSTLYTMPESEARALLASIGYRAGMSAAEFQAAVPAGEGKAETFQIALQVRAIELYTKARALTDEADACLSALSSRADTQ